jgi:hypothetical protein
LEPSTTRDGECRYNVNPDEKVGPLAGFESRFNNSDIFRSASEICSIFLVPQLIPNLGATIPRLNTAMTYPPGSTPPASRWEFPSRLALSPAYLLCFRAPRRARFLALLS